MDLSEFAAGSRSRGTAYRTVLEAFAEPVCFRIDECMEKKVPLEMERLKYQTGLKTVAAHAVLGLVERCRGTVIPARFWSRSPPLTAQLAVGRSLVGTRNDIPHYR